MAKKVLVVDDLDGESEAEYIDLEIGYDGYTYTLDMSEHSKKELDDALAPFLSVARKRSGGPRKVTRRAPAAARPGTVVALRQQQPVPVRGEAWYLDDKSLDHEVRAALKEMRKDVREWAKVNGWATLGDFGRVPQDAYDAWYDRVYAPKARDEE